MYWLASPRTPTRQTAIVQLRAALAAVLAPAQSNLGPEALGPRIIDLLLQSAAFAEDLLCALHLVAGRSH